MTDDREQVYRLRADAPNDLAYVLDMPDKGLVTLSRGVGGRTIITAEEFRVRFMERVS